MVQLIIAKTVFDEYFKLLNKIQYDYLMDDSEEPNNEDYNRMDIIKENIKSQIKKIFENDIKSNHSIPTNNNFNRLVYTNFADDSNDSSKSQWIETDNKIKLYYHWLFESDRNENFSECIDYWFEEGRGYWEKNSRLQDNRLVLDFFRNISCLDPIGSTLKMKTYALNLHHILDPKIILDMFDYGKQSLTNPDYSIYLSDIDKYYSFVPQTYTDTNLGECFDLIEIFDIFFGLVTNPDHNIQTNPKVMSGIRIESTDKSPIKIPLKNSNDNSDNPKEWISEIDINSTPIDFIIKIKKQIDLLYGELKSTDNSGQKELKDNFLSDLNLKLDKYIENYNW